jgi:hypothetical protein
MLVVFFSLLNYLICESSSNLENDISFEECVSYEYCFVVNYSERYPKNFVLSDTSQNHTVSSSNLGYYYSVTLKGDIGFTVDSNVNFTFNNLEVLFFVFV